MMECSYGTVLDSDFRLPLKKRVSEAKQLPSGEQIRVLNRMEISSSINLSLHLVSSAIRRCWLSQSLCRVSISVNRSSSASGCPTLRVSISDTGIGSCVEEFKSLKCTQSLVAENFSGGVLSIATTRISDDEVQHYQIDTKKVVSARRVTVLPSQPKNGAKFSGTEVSFSTARDISGLLPEILCFIKKMPILGIPVFSVHFQNDLIDIMVQHHIEPVYQNPVGTPNARTADLLKSGFEDYILKHGNKSDTICSSCFPDQSKDILKVGTGMVQCIEGEKNAGLLVEVVVIISESKDPSSPCFRAFGANTEVVLFNDFSPSLLTQPSLTALKNMDWKSYGLTLGNVLDLEGHVLIEWENLPADVQIDIAIHCHQSLAAVLPGMKISQFDLGKRLKKALKHALEDVKEKHAGILLSPNAHQVCSYAPDLAKTIAGLIVSSNDFDFQGECVKLLGLDSHDQNIGKESIEACLNEKILKAISLNDKKKRRGKEPATLLFECEAESFPDADSFLEEEFD